MTHIHTVQCIFCLNLDLHFKQTAWNLEISFNLGFWQVLSATYVQSSILGTLERCIRMRRQGPVLEVSQSGEQSSPFPWELPGYRSPWSSLGRQTTSGHTYEGESQWHEKWIQSRLFGVRYIALLSQEKGHHRSCCMSQQWVGTQR